MSCHELCGYTCQYKFSGNGNKECYHSFYCWRGSSFLIHTNAAFPLLLTKALAVLQNEYYYKIFYYSTVNIWLSLLLCSQMSKEDFTLIILLYCQVRKTDFQISALLKGWMAFFPGSPLVHQGALSYCRLCYWLLCSCFSSWM